jgi:hypothetical protein
MEGVRMSLGKRLALAGALALALGGFAFPTAAHGQEGAQGRVVRVARPQGWIGVTLDLQHAWRPGAPAAPPTMVITQVYDGSPADRVGLQAGDTILRINRRPVSEEAIEQLQASLEPGTAVVFQFRRDGRIRTVAARAESRPADEELESLPPQVRVRVESAQAELLQHLDSVARFGLFGEGSGPRTLFVFGAQGDSLVMSFQGPAGTTRFPSGAAFDRTWTVAAGPAPAPFEGVVARRTPQVQVYTTQQRPRPGAEALRQAELEIVRAGMAQAERALTELEQHRRPLAPYILGQDVIAGAKLAPLNPDLAQYFGVSRGLLVVSVVDDTPAADAGVLSGDVIIASGSRALSTVEELRSIFFASSRGGASLPITLIRKGRTLQLALPH